MKSRTGDFCLQFIWMMKKRIHEICRVIIWSNKVHYSLYCGRMQVGFRQDACVAHDLFLGNVEGLGKPPTHFNTCTHFPIDQIRY